MTSLEEQRRHLGRFIRSQRRLADLSLRQLADLTDVSNAYLSQIERGQHEPSVRVLKAIATALNVSAEVLLTQLGVFDEDGAPADQVPDVVQAIRADPRLSDAQKQALVGVYRSYLAESD